MDFIKLRYFLAAAQEGNMTRAAKMLHISQPSLSVQIRELEEQMGKPLFQRGRQLALTAEGRLLRQRAEEILSLADKTEKEIAEGTAVGGDLFIGSGDRAGLAKVLRASAPMRRAHPRVCWHIFSGDAKAILERIDQGLVDFGVVIDPIDLCRYERLDLHLRDVWGLLLRDDHPLAAKKEIHPEDLAGVPLVLPQRAGLQREIESWLGRDIASLTKAAEFNLIYHARLLVEEGFGPAATTSRLVRAEERQGLCFRPFAPQAEIHYCLAWKRYRPLSPAAEAFLAAVREGIGRSAP